MDLAERISKLSPEQRKLLELKLKRKGKGIDVLHIPITKENRQNLDHFPLSFGQERLWFIDQLEPGNPAYNMVRVTKLEGNLDKNALERSINNMIRRHEILRTLFAMTDGKPEQVILPTLTIPLTLIDLKNLETVQQALEIKQVIETESQYSFDLAKGPLLRTHLLELNPDNYLFLLVIHHIVSDGTSIQVFIREVVRFYEAFSNGGGVPVDLPQLPIQYVDYACWQRQWLQGGETNGGFIKKQGDYWLNEFSGDIPVLTLPTDYSRPALQSFEGSIVYFNISVEETEALKRIVSREKTTLYILLLALYNIFLSKLSGMEDIVVGTPVAGRRHPSLQHMIGMFVNTLALRNYPGSDKGFGQFLQEIKNRTLKAFENQEYRYEDIIARAAVSRDTSRNPLFDVMFLLKNLDYAEVNLPGLTLRPWDYERKTAMFDLTLSASEEGDRLQFSFDYCTKLFDVETIHRFINYFKQVVRSVVELSRGSDFDVKLSDIEITPSEERKKILDDFNNTGADYSWDKTVHELFEEQVEKTPDHIALIFEDKRLSYKELNGRSNQLARFLRAKGVKAGSIVGISADRSLELLVAVFSVLKAGGVYLPLDPGHPEKRIKYMLKASDTEVVLTNNRLLSAIEFTLVDLNDEENYKSDPSHLNLSTSPGGSAYVIYTSGTTGIPKGVVIEHRSFVNFIKGMTDVIDFKGEDSVLSLTTVSFDIFGLETLVSLTQGSAVVIGNSEEQMDPLAAVSVMEREAISILQVTPSRLQLLLSAPEVAKYFNPLRYLIVGGEAFPGRLLEQIRLLVKGKIYNVYGPTETTVWSTVKDLTGDACLNIGKPIANTGIYILDKYLQPVPIGVVGEIYIGGAGVARGYLNNPELTNSQFQRGWQPQPIKKRGQAKKTTAGFPTHPTHPLNHSPIYRTGDLGRWLPDGDIECLGRVDHQVKIRGFRIELGEIEHQLGQHKDIEEVVVLAEEDKKENKYLCAYIVVNKELAISEFRGYLSDKLPAYMIPAYFVKIDGIPVTPNGKIDSKALRRSGGERLDTGDAYAAPGDEIEKRIQNAWQELLGRERISVNDNFFDLGGDSLKAITLIPRMQKEINAWVPLSEFFKTPTISGLAAYVRKGSLQEYQAIEEVEKKEFYAASPLQKRLYILHQMEGIHTTYNTSHVLTVTGKPDRQRLERAFQWVIRRHESLRTSFTMQKDEPVQVVHELEEVKFHIQYIKVKENEIEKMNKTFIRSFDLSKAPLLRVGLVGLSEEKHLLVFDIHHIISDGISFDILIRDFIAFYEGKGKELPLLRIQYKDFSEWQNRELGKPRLKQQEDYWREQFKDGIPMLEIFTDYSRPPVQSFEGDRVSFTFAREFTQQLNHLMKETETTLYMVLLAAYTILLTKLSGQEDIVVGTPISGREHVDFEHVIGIFINVLCMRNYPVANKTFIEFLNEVKETSINAYENQGYPFGELIDKLDATHDLSRNPLYDAEFIVQNMDVTALEIEGLQLTPYPYDMNVSQHDISLQALESKSEIHFSLTYCKKLFKRETVEEFIDFFKKILSLILKDKEMKLADIVLSHDLGRVEVVLPGELVEDFGF